MKVYGFYSSFILFWVGGLVGGWVAVLVENIATSAPTKAGVWAGAELGKKKLG